MNNCSNNAFSCFHLFCSTFLVHLIIWSWSIWSIKIIFWTLIYSSRLEEEMIVKHVFFHDLDITNSGKILAIRMEHFARKQLGNMGGYYHSDLIIEWIVFLFFCIYNKFYLLKNLFTYYYGIEAIFLIFISLLISSIL